MAATSSEIVSVLDSQTGNLMGAVGDADGRLCEPSAFWRTIAENTLIIKESDCEIRYYCRM